jgi:hypothetical protein
MWGSDNRLKAPKVRKTKIESTLMSLAEESSSAVRAASANEPNYNLLKTIEVYPEVITKPELVYDADSVTELREPIAAPNDFKMPALPGMV